eukprot:2625313-Rhodomonas_salina.1
MFATLRDIRTPTGARILVSLGGWTFLPDPGRAVLSRHAHRQDFSASSHFLFQRLGQTKKGAQSLDENTGPD